MGAHNGGHGMYGFGLDGWLLDNWLTGNGGAGYYADKDTAAITFTGNRVEWNRLAGFKMTSNNMLNITGNCFDRNGGPALWLTGDTHDHSGNTTVTGNIFKRNGASKSHADPHLSSQLYLTHIHGIVVTGNTARAHRGDEEGTNVAPHYGLVYGHLTHSIIKDNVLYKGAMKELTVDLGGNEECVIGGNIGSLHP